MSPAVLRGVLGSCLALGAADLAWLDVNAEKMESPATAEAAGRIEPVGAGPSVQRLSAVVSPPISDEAPLPARKEAPLPSSGPPEACVVHFDRGVAIVNDDQAKMLAPIAEALKSNPKAVVRVEGHTDRTGFKGKGSNLLLSDERAGAIVRALAKLGVPRDRIRSAAFGDKRPVDQGSSEDAYRRNRRAEVRIDLTGDG